MQEIVAQQVSKAIDSLKEGDRILAWPLDSYLEPDPRITGITMAKAGERSTLHLTQKQLLKKLLDEGCVQTGFESVDGNHISVMYERPGPGSYSLRADYARAVWYKAFEFSTFARRPVMKEAPSEDVQKRIRGFGDEFEFLRKYDRPAGLILEAYFRKERDRREGVVMAYTEGTLPGITPADFAFLEY